MARCVALAVLLSAAACESGTDVSADVTGRYMLSRCWEANSQSEGCTRTDSTGALVSVVGGELVVGPPGTAHRRYEWYLQEGPIDAPASTPSSLFSAGTYNWDGQTLSLEDDSTAFGPITASVEGSKITLSTERRRFEFGKLVSLPPG